MNKTTLVQPYLMFNGRCEEAVKFYQTALGAEVVMIMRYQDSPEPMPPGMMPENWGEKVMHAGFKIAGNLIMASDGCTPETGFSGFSLSLALPDEAAAHAAYAALAEGGRAHMPMAKTFWSPYFGMVQDQFGLSWMVTVVDEYLAKP